MRENRCGEFAEAQMELVVKRFSELSAEELFEIYKLRVSIFVVEQNCPYQEVDDADRVAHHLWFRDQDAKPTRGFCPRNVSHCVNWPCHCGQTSVRAGQQNCGSGD